MENRTRATIQAEIEECNDRIEAITAQRLELIKEDLLLCDETQRFEKKTETYTVRENRKKVTKERVVGRVFWKETFYDEDTGKGITIERNRVVRINGEWL